MSTPPLEGADLTAARHLCHHYGVGGHTGGSFASSLIRTLENADLENRERLLTAFPVYRRAAHILMTQGAQALADTVKISDRIRLGQTKPPVEDGELGPATLAQIRIRLTGGEMPDALTALRDIAGKIDEAQRLGFSAGDFIRAYTVQLSKLEEKENTR